MNDFPKNLFKKYAGMRVVLVKGKVIAADRDAVTAVDRAKKKYPNEKLTIFAVPVKGYKHMLI